MEALLDQVEAIEDHVLAYERLHLALLPAIHPRYRESARNLLHYVALRQLDLRRLQLDLARAGLSSLGRSEGAVLSALHQVRQRIAEALHSAALAPELEPEVRERLLNRVARARRPGPVPALDGDRAEVLLHEHTRALLGTKPAHRHVSVMVTAPAAAEADRRWLSGLLAAGMDCLRLNCAHEDEVAWQRVFDALSAATAESGRTCRVLMDIAGPKLRTGALAPGAAVVVFRPQRDSLGRVVQPAIVPIVSVQHGEVPGVALALPLEQVSQLAEGDELRVTDTRGRRRKLHVLGVQSDRAIARCEKSLFLAEGCRVEVRRQGRPLFTGRAGPVPPRPQAIELSVGDSFLLTGEPIAGQPALRGEGGELVHPAIVPCTLPLALEHLQPGQRVLFDDGKIEALVESVSLPRATLRVVRAGSGRARLRAEKGINFPETRIDVEAVTDEDRLHLGFAARHADAVGLSFLRTAADVRQAVSAVQQAAQLVGRSPDRSLGLVIKVETRSAFDQLPALLLAAMESFPAGVMIARGDLAVEIGFERLAEVQEEILWLCEAAHLPSIWATQVLDELAQTGVPSRAEVTDASMAVRAECVMLNKGPFVDRAVRALDDILRRMEHHTYKKRALYRRLSISDALAPLGEEPAAPPIHPR